MQKVLRMSFTHPRFVSVIVLCALVSIIYWCSSSTSECPENEYREFKAIRKYRNILLAKVEEMKAEVKKLQAIKNSHIESQKKEQELPTIFCITPTYTRFTQKADLTRLSQTFLHVPRFHWIVVEDSEHKTQLVEDLLRESTITYTHLAVRTQGDLIRRGADPRWRKHRGVDQRNAALKWIRNNIEAGKGVVYFADDDNTYHLKVFEEMRHTKAVSIWPVALVGGLLWEGPICSHGKVNEFYTSWEPERKFPVDMASFAIDLNLLIEAGEVYINPESRRGHLESDFLSALGITKDDLEAKADNCKKILVWHTQTAEPNMKREKKLQAMGQGSDPSIEI